MIDRNESKNESVGELEDLMGEFQGIDSPSASLLCAVDRGRRKLVRGRIVMVVIILFVWAVAIYAYATHRDVPTFVFSVTQIGVTGTLAAFVLRSSRNAWRARTQTTRGFLDLELERRRDWIRRMRFLRHRIVPVMFVMMAVHHALLIHANPSMVSGRGLLAELVGFGFPCALLAGITWHSRRRQDRFEREAENIAGRILELSENDSKVHL